MSRGLVVETRDSRGKQRLTIEKVHNPSSGVMSQTSTEFLSMVWNKATMEYLNSVRQLKTKKLNEIFDEAKELVPQNSQETCEAPELLSEHATLCSDDEDATW